MSIKYIAVAAPVMALGIWMCAPSNSWSKTVARPESVVMSSLAELDLPRGETPQDNGVDVRLERGTDQLRWVVHSGGKVAATMIADFEPQLDGTTRVNARIEHGETTPGETPAGYRSKSGTLAMFSAALDTRLERLANPSPTPENCAELREQFAETYFADLMRRSAGGNPSGAAQASLLVRVATYLQEARRIGCDVHDGSSFHSSGSTDWGGSSSGWGRTVKAGQPMVDPRPAGDRRW